MFLSKNKNIVDQNTLISDETILQFSIAEFSSAVEMLHSAKLTDNHKLQIGFIQHALDEYRHLDFFKSILKMRNSKLIFIPILSTENNYLDSRRLLFEKLSLIEFSAFVSVNERYAYNLFCSLRKKLFWHDSIIDNQLEEIIEEERVHKNHADSGALFDSLIEDELGHFTLSLKFLMKNASLIYSKFLILRYLIQNRTRHLLGRELFIKRIFEMAILNLVIFVLKLLDRMMRFDLRIGSICENKKCLRLMI